VPVARPPPTPGPAPTDRVRSYAGSVTKENFRFALLCGFAAFAAGLIMVMFATAPYNGNLSALVRMDPADSMAVDATSFDPSFAFVKDGHYDGVYAYTIALDPFARGSFHNKIDYPAYRYGRAGYGWMARLFCFGKPALIPTVLVLLNLVGLAVAGFGASRLAVLFGWPAASGIAVALNPGFLIGITLDTSEGFSAGLLVLALLAWFREDRWVAVGLMAFLCLIKEPFIAVPLGLMVWEFASRGKDAWRQRKGHLFSLAAALVPLAVWWSYLSVRLGEWPFAQSWLVEKPVMGYLDTMMRSAQMAGDGIDVSQIAIPQLAFVLMIGLAFLFGIGHALRFRTPIDPIFLGFVGVFSILSWWQLLYAKELFRILAIPLMLLPAVLVGAPKRWRST